MVNTSSVSGVTAASSFGSSNASDIDKSSNSLVDGQDSFGAAENSDISNMASNGYFGSNGTGAESLQTVSDHFAQLPTTAESLLAQGSPLDLLQDTPPQNNDADRPQDDQGGGLFDSIGDWASSTKDAVTDAAEDVGEWAGEVNEEYSIGTRALGALTVAGGVGEAALGSLGIVAPEPATSVAGAVLFVHGADTAAAGLRTIWTGESQQTLTESGATAAAEAVGVDETNAERIGMAVDIGVGFVNFTNTARNAGQATITEGLERAPDLLGDAERLANGRTVVPSDAVDNVARGIDQASDVTSELRWSGGTGTASGRPFDPENAGGPILNLDWSATRIDADGVADVRTHLARFEDYAPNDRMVERLDAIAQGDIQPTDFDLRFFTHEVRELERYRNLEIPDNVDPGYDVWNNAHTATLEDFNIAEYDALNNSTLYHPDTLGE